MQIYRRGEAQTSADGRTWLIAHVLRWHRARDYQFDGVPDLQSWLAELKDAFRLHLRGRH